MGKKAFFLMISASIFAPIHRIALGMNGEA